ncbi:MAG: transketolase, partial [Alphaproteobacteria bacterium]|nr:transketolase [Alphaproteobacteria bacterium]
PKHPHWPDRDRFILSAGHGSMLQYALLYLTGYEDMTLDELKRFRQLGAKTAGHPEYGHVTGIETTTGPLGQGLANAVGMALAERILNARFGDELVNHKTYVIASDGDLMEGISQEAIALAGHLRLNRLIVLFDDNGISIDGKTSLADSTDQIERFQASGWNTVHADGHDAADVARALHWAQTSDKPVLIACRTVIGFGLPTRQGTQKAHSDAPGAEEIAGARKALDWNSPPFVIPDDVLSDWRAIGRRGAKARDLWLTRRTPEFDAAMAAEVPDALAPALLELKHRIAEEKPSVATRKSSESVLEVVNAVWSATLGGSADLTGSNNTKTKNIEVLTPQNYGGRYIHYGIREHAMAAAMNGMALHGGVVPYGGTFLAFSDYCRPAIRLAAIMGVRVVFVMTHDSIGLGEDGPTHQPVEHFAALRAMPRLLAMRPADGIETAEAWQIALSSRTRPSLLMLSRQNLQTFRTAPADDNRTARGAYELAGADEAKVTLLSSGSEVEVAMNARDMLAKDGIAARVVSMPCWALFEEQPATYRDAVLGPGTVKVAVEAGVRLGWDRYIGPEGAFVGMHSFGASGPYKDVYRHFGITPEAVAEAAKKAMK